MILAGVVVGGWFGVTHGQVDKPVLSLAGALIAAGAYLGWNREDQPKN